MKDVLIALINSPRALLILLVLVLLQAPFQIFVGVMFVRLDEHVAQLSEKIFCEPCGQIRFKSDRMAEKPETNGGNG